MRVAGEPARRAPEVGGCDLVLHQNEENNAGMRRVNTQMGYVVLFGVWRHELLRG